jgi:hypothetical protein
MCDAWREHVVDGRPLLSALHDDHGAVASYTGMEHKRQAIDDRCTDYLDGYDSVFAATTHIQPQAGRMSRPITHCRRRLRRAQKAIKSLQSLHV